MESKHEHEAPDGRDDVTVNIIISNEAHCSLTKLMTYFSDWYKLRRAVAVFLKVKELLRHRVRQRHTPDGCKIDAMTYAINVQDIANDKEPLTPNHILTGKSCVTIAPPGVFQKEDLYTRRRWRRTQYLANLFWTRYPRKGQRYTLLLDGGLIKGWGSKDSWLLIVCRD